MTAGTVLVPSCCVVVCAYTERRWGQIVAGCSAAAAQLREGDELVLVIDHAEELRLRAIAELPEVRVVASTGPPGLSGARNTGVAESTAEVVVFLDDDACPEPGWLDAYRASFADQRVQVVGGAVTAVWAGGDAPRWFPDEFGWVVGCDYRGLAGDGALIRNPIGANMAVRRTALDASGGFATDVGRMGDVPLGCEETDLCIRVRQRDPGAVITRNTAAVVRHAVSADRRRVRYFFSRCYYEGRSKAVLTGRVGGTDGLASERSYAAVTLPSGVFAGLRDAATGRPAGLLRAAAIVGGLGATGTGYVTGLAAQRAAASRSAAPKLHAAPNLSDPNLSDPDLSDPDLSDIDLSDPTQVEAPAEPRAWQPLVLSEYPLEGHETSDAAGSATPGTRLRLLVTSAGTPLGVVDVPGAGADSTPAATPAELVERIADSGGLARPLEDFTGSSSFAPAVSVVVPTRGRSFELVRCVRSLLAVDYPELEVLVVDNNDQAGAVAELLAPVRDDPRLRILHQPERGVSPARNLGISEARHEIIAATDDDVVVSSQWLRELVAPFVDPTIACVTGLVLPAGFSTPAQEMFEEYGGFSKGFHPARYDLGDFRSDHVLYPYSPGIYGSGNNVAYRRSVITALGGYDRRLGPGTPARAGEDLDVFLKILFSGASVYYQPRAWVRHHHRDTLDELGSQIRDYGRGLSAVLATWALSDPRRTLGILRRVPAGLRRLLDPKSGKNEARSAAYPVELRRQEIRGMAEGLVLTVYDRVRHPEGLRERRRPLAQVAPAPEPDPEPSREVSRHAV